jgi:hypothetical protein
VGIIPWQSVSSKIAKAERVVFLLQYTVSLFRLE